MKRISTTLLFIVVAYLIVPAKTLAQQTTIVDSSAKGSVIVIPGNQYQRSSLHKLLWGPQWRKEWSTPVRVPVLNIDTAFGGLTPTETGGGKQTKNLRFRSNAGREYAIRSVDKSYGKSLPEEFQGTFIPKIVDDQMSSAYPYAGIIIKELSAAAVIYSTEPTLYFVKEHPRLDTFNKEYANLLYTLEDRPGTNNLKYYGAEQVADAEEMYTALQKNPYEKIDQVAYAKARLFDLLLGDWDRHFDQWKWAKKDPKGDAIYFPMPKDRDQAFSSYDGLLVRSATKSGGLTMLQPFRGDIPNVEGFTWVYRHFDAPLLNEVSKETWIAKANELQAQLTDNVIDAAVKLMPAEVYAFSGAALAATLKQRRDNLAIFAEAFYLSLAKEAIILGSEANDKIELVNENDHALRINLYKGDKQQPFYSRSFNDDETKEIRIYGMKGADRFTTSGTKNNNIIVRLLGGPESDQYEIPSAGASKVIVYDDKENDLKASTAKLRITQDTMLYKYDAKTAPHDAAGISPLLGYTNEDRIFVGLGYRAINHSFMEKPFASKNELAARYSITQKAFSFGYKGLFRNVIRHIDLGLLAEYDQVRDQHFLGIGNNTVKASDVKQYYRYRNKEANVGANLIANLSKYQTLTVGGFYQMVQVYNDGGKFISDNFTASHTAVLDKQNFMGARAAYNFTKVNPEVVPKSGGAFRLGYEHTTNTGNKKIVNKVSGLAGVILPIGPLTFSSVLGAAKLWGEPEFYQLNKLGGGTTLRGYLRFRLYGNTSVYNQNELQWNFNVKSYLFNGKAGLVALFDNGRVWMPGETSDKWYSAYGGGIMIAPFNKLSVTATYAVSDEDQRISLRLGHLLGK